MEYFAAVQEGRARVKKAVDLLQEVAGPSSPVLFLKMGGTDWEPVGEEMLFVLIPGRNSKEAVVVCDGEGNSKAISGWFPPGEAERVAASLREKGLAIFDGEVRLPL